ncbi:hypothetical protein ACFVZR_34190 [Streptomyces sp. NPDC058316]|uniref:hypothetical protein n=1 Tax=unclassified Streptomyces TaxID=2593676 RepID=UPI00331A6F7C
MDVLRFARRVAVRQATAALDQIDAWIAAEEQRQAARQRATGMRPCPRSGCSSELECAQVYPAASVAPAPKSGTSPPRSALLCGVDHDFCNQVRLDQDDVERSA